MQAGLFTTSLLAAVLTASVAAADAQTPDDQTPTADAIQIGLAFRYGIGTNSDDFNPWSKGLGVDFGYTLPSAVYLGGTFEYFFGETAKTSVGDREGNALHVMAEGGYDIAVDEHVVFRPKLGAGVAHLRSEVCVHSLCESGSSTNVAVAPGLGILLVTTDIGLALDTRYVMLVDDGVGGAAVFSIGALFY